MTGSKTAVFMCQREPSALAVIVITPLSAKSASVVSRTVAVQYDPQRRDTGEIPLSLRRRPIRHVACHIDTKANKF